LSSKIISVNGLSRQQILTNLGQELIHNLVQENNLDLEIKWIKGKDNFADSLTRKKNTN